MIIKSSQRSNPKQLGLHLKSDENERVSFVDLDGVLSTNITEALIEFAEIAKGTRATKPLYHVSISPEKSACMTKSSWQQCWALHDKVHNLEGLSFIEVEHQKKGRTHRHRVYSRIDIETGTARNLGWTRI